MQLKSRHTPRNFLQKFDRTQSTISNNKAVIAAWRGDLIGAKKLYNNTKGIFALVTFALWFDCMINKKIFQHSVYSLQKSENEN